MTRPTTGHLLAELRGTTRPDWFRFENHAGTDEADVYLYNEIGYWGTTAGEFLTQLAGLDASTLNVHLNSPGGEIFDGIAIANALRNHPATVNVYVDSLAASIASVIAMAGDRVVMAPNSQLMIHDGSGLCIGDAAEMRKTADLLDRQSDNIAAAYATRAGGTVPEWRARMVAETWYTADEAVAAGLADEVSSVHSLTDDNSPRNLWEMSILGRLQRQETPVPAPVNSVAEAPVPPTADPGPVNESPPGGAADEPAVDAEAVVETPPAADPEPAPAPAASPWAAATAHLTAPAPAPADAFRRLTEALL